MAERTQPLTKPELDILQGFRASLDKHTEAVNGLGKAIREVPAIAGKEVDSRVDAANAGAYTWGGCGIAGSLLLRWLWDRLRSPSRPATETLAQQIVQALNQARKSQ